MWIDIYDIDNNKLGAGPIRNVEFFEATAMLNAAGTYRFGGIPTDPRTMDLLLDDSGQRIALGWEMVEGEPTFVGGGPIHQRIVTGEPDSWKLEISGPDLLGELSYDTIGALTLSGSGSANIAALLAYLPADWIFTVVESTTSFVAKFSNETLLNALVAVAKEIGSHFYLEPLANVRHLRWRPDYQDSGIIASGNANPLDVERNPNLCLITNIKETQDSWDIINTVVVFGAGIGETRFNMTSATIWPDGSVVTIPYVLDGQTYIFDRTANTITNATSVAVYGTRKMQLPFKGVRPLFNGDADVLAAANFLVLASVTWLSKHSRAEKFYEMGVAGLRQFLLPGSTIRAQVRKWVNGRKPIDIDADLIALSTTRRWDSSGHYTTGMQVATVGRYPASGDDATIESMGQSIVMEAHPQTGPAIDTITYREHLDDAAHAHLFFFLGNEVLTVNQVIVRLRVDPLRSTVTTVAGDASVAIGGTIDISHQHPIPHNHSVTVNGGSGLTDHVVFNGGSGFGFLNKTGAGNGFFDTDTPAGTLTSSAGGSTTLALTGSVDLSDAVSVEYGVFDDSPAHTYLATDLDWQVNGGGYVPITSGNVISGATGWYLLDITNKVAAALSGRPLATVFDVEFKVHAPGPLKKAQITAQIERRMSVQAIAVY